MILPDMQLLAQTAAARILNSIPEGLAIAGLTWLLLRITARQTSGAKFIVWFAALLAVAALPFVPHSSSGLVGAPAASPVVLPAAWGIGIFAIWLLIAGRAMTEIVVGLRKVRRLRITSVELSDGDTDPSVRQTIEEIQATRSIEIRRSDAVTVPTAIGFFRPAILLPAWAVEELSAEELKVVLFHEFAHLRRWDDWTNLAQKLVRTVFFFHPAVWWIERRLSLEREMACDDFVVAETANPQAYAECLVSLAERSVVRRGLALAQAVIGRARETAQRLARILDSDRHTGDRSFRPALGVAVALMAIASLVTPYRPNLVSFESAAPSPIPHDLAIPPALSATTVLPVAQNTAHLAALKPSRKAMVPKATERLAMLTRPAASKGQMANSVTARQSENVVFGPQFVVVMQTTEFDGQRVRQGFCVWQITVDRADRRVIREELIVRAL